MKVADLLKNKGEAVITISPDATIFQAMQQLLDHNIGSLVVCDMENKIVGIISERDILRATYQDCNALQDKTVSDLMSTSLIVAIPDDEINYIMGIMTQNRIRHLPIVTKEGIAGIISIGDIVKFQLEETKVKNRYLEEYLYGHYPL